MPFWYFHSKIIHRLGRGLTPKELDLLWEMYRCDLSLDQMIDGLTLKGEKDTVNIFDAWGFLGF